MAIDLDIPTAGPKPVAPTPIVVTRDFSTPDRIFRRSVQLSGLSVFVLLVAIGSFLAWSGWPAFRAAGWSFFTHSGPVTPGKTTGFGVLASLTGTVEVAFVAMLVGAPVAVCTALFLSEYAPLKTRRSLIAMIDLAAAIPSIIFGLWAFFELQPNVVGFSTWLSRHASFIPFFRVTSPPLNASILIAGLVVGLMIVPIIASICREVFSLAPAGEREAALALGASRWQMIRTVVLPFGRGGMIGAVMLGLGRALEETIAVSIILGGTYKVTIEILQHGGTTISQLIATNFGSGGSLGLHDLLLCGFVLFVLTLVINLAASAIVNRSRSGAGVDL
ncbi:MAG: phosphate ABC transporter permease subunit PstC [Acidimicrobiales bacterium]|jgi:phosphate transport system permease protein